ncbi:PIN domain nuclease [Candidatus Sumerlaeota bacterium]|nr:PIN domain nuclease [Candidatus Sumerlaeota bacterium]
MALVDTSVWVDLFCNSPGPHVRTLEALLVRGENLCICGIILTEVLQGIRDDREYQRVRKRFDALLFLPMTRETFIRAAEIYRSLRRRGVTVRNPVDCMIASVAIENDVALLHNDRAFDPMARYCGLRVVDHAVTGRPQRHEAGLS